MQIISIKTPIFEEGDNLLNFIKKQISFLEESSVIVVTSKIVALSQKRVGRSENKNKLIKENSKKIIDTPWALLAFTLGEWRINAGIDESNAKNKIILLPQEPFAVAKKIQKSLKKHFSVKRLGVIITDTRSMPLRIGTIGKPLAFVGFDPLKSYVGKKDLFGRKSRLTKNNIADSLSAAAVLVMGEGNEQTPLAVIKDAPIKFTNKISKKYLNLAHPPETDIYAWLYKNFSNKKMPK
jgi:coenzyme F420-0:L-glutamate ligase